MVGVVVVRSPLPLVVSRCFAATRLFLLVLRDPGVVAIVVCVVRFTFG